ncbi:MAG: RNA chaperone Hfq [Ignavibacteriales bacterium]
MTKNQINLQDAFLNQLRKERIAVTIYLVNGFQIKGIVKGFDNFTAIVEQDGRQQMVYKHAISTISPMRPINIISMENKTEEE